MHIDAGMHAHSLSKLAHAERKRQKNAIKPFKVEGLNARTTPKWVYQSIIEGKVDLRGIEVAFSASNLRSEPSGCRSTSASGERAVTTRTLEPEERKKKRAAPTAATTTRAPITIPTMAPAERAFPPLAAATVAPPSGVAAMET